MSAALEKAVRDAIPPGKFDVDRALAYVAGALATYRREKRGAAAPSISSQRAQLKKAASYAGKLSACLKSLNAETSVYLTPTANDLWPQQWWESIDKLKAHAEGAYKAMATARKTAPKDPALHSLLQTLSLVWHQSHPRQYGVTRGSHGGDAHKYGGPFLDFAHAVLTIEGIKLTYSALGKRLYNDHLHWKSPRRRVPNTE